MFVCIIWRREWIYNVNVDSICNENTRDILKEWEWELKWSYFSAINIEIDKKCNIQYYYYHTHNAAPKYNPVALNMKGNQSSGLLFKAIDIVKSTQLISTTWYH